MPRHPGPNEDFGIAVPGRRIYVVYAVLQQYLQGTIRIPFRTRMRAAPPKIVTVLMWLRIPLIPAVYSGARRPPVPIHSGHLFRTIPAIPLG